MPRRRKAADNQPMPLSAHLKELRNRLFLVVSVLMLTSSLVYAFRAQIIPIILQPYEAIFDTEKLMYLNPAGGFSFIFFISIYAGLAITIPVLIHQIYCFLRPTLPKDKRVISGRMLISSGLLLIAGVSFGYFVAVPGALDFLQEFADEYVSASLTADSYLHFLVAYTVGLGILFQIPLVLLIIHYIRPLTPGGLLKSQRWVIVLSMIAAAIITPTPDPVNMLIVAIPIIIIYQFGVIAILISVYSQRKKDKQKHRAAETVTQEKPATNTVVPAPPMKPSPTQPAVTRPRQVVRSIDGIAASPYRPRQITQIPVRPPAKTERSVASTAVKRAPSSSSRRYIDGVSPIYRSV